MSGAVHIKRAGAGGKYKEPGGGTNGHHGQGPMEAWILGSQSQRHVPSQTSAFQAGADQL